jgi:hypothetical protein
VKQVLKGDKVVKMALSKEVTVNFEWTIENQKSNDSNLNLSAHFLSNGKSEDHNKVLKSLKESNTTN